MTNWEGVAVVLMAIIGLCLGFVYMALGWFFRGVFEKKVVK